MKRFTTETRVRYAETDATGIVYYANYFIYFELGRIDMFRQLALPYDWRLPIVQTNCRYHASAKFDDILQIETTVEELRTKSFRLGSRVYRQAEGDGQTLLVRGHTVMVTLDAEQQPTALPELYRTALAPLLVADVKHQR